MGDHTKKIEEFPPRCCRGGFLFVLVPQQVSYGDAKVLGDLVGRCGVEVFFSAHFQVGNDSPADTQLGAEPAGGDFALGAEGVDAVVDG